MSGDPRRARLGVDPGRVLTRSGVVDTAAPSRDSLGSGVMDNVTSLSLARVAIGSAAYAAPELSLKAMMLDHTHRETPIFVRLFGVRDLALGLAILLAKPQHKRALLGLAMLVDAGDAGAGYLALRSGAVKPAVGIGLTAAGASAVLAGAAAVMQQRRA